MVAKAHRLTGLQWKMGGTGYEAPGPRKLDITINDRLATVLDP
jgi:hypothetical protein